MIKSRIYYAWKNFWNDTRGVISVEIALILPLLIWTFAAIATFFDAYRSRSIAEKAAYTVSDMLSRETNAITDTYIDNTLTFFDALADSQTGSSLRVSVISWNSAMNSYEIDWSEARGAGFLALDNDDVDDIEPRLPLMSDHDALILVETLNRYTPVIDVGLGEINIDTFVFTRPRYAPQLAFDGAA